TASGRERELRSLCTAKSRSASARSRALMSYSISSADCAQAVRAERKARGGGKPREPGGDGSLAVHAASPRSCSPPRASGGSELQDVRDRVYIISRSARSRRGPARG